MNTTKPKRAYTFLYKEQTEMLDYLTDYFKESKSLIIRKAIERLYQNVKIEQIYQNVKKEEK